MNERRLGWTLAGVGFLLVSTDSCFVRLSGASDWDVAFIVSAFALPAYLIMNRIFGKSGPIAAFRAYPGPLLFVAFNAAVSQLTFIAAITRTEIANVVVVIGAAPVLAALAGWALNRERTDLRTWMAIALALVGVLIVVSGSLGSPSLEGDLFALASIAVFSVNFTIWRRYPEMNRFVGLGLSALLTLVVSAPFVSTFTPTRSVLVPLALMGFVFSPLGRICHTNAPRFASAAEVGLFVPVATVAATIWAWIAFSETPDERTLLGGALVIAAVLWGTFGRLMTSRVPVS